MGRGARAGLMVGLLIVGAARPLLARDEASRAGAALAAEVMSPFCPGLTLLSCTSGAAIELRTEIVQRFRDGQTHDRILADLIARYGEGVRGAPVWRGWGLVAWTAPWVGGLALLAAIVGLGRRRRDTAPIDPDADRQPSDLQRRLDDELRELE